MSDIYVMCKLLLSINSENKINYYPKSWKLVHFKTMMHLSDYVS